MLLVTVAFCFNWAILARVVGGKIREESGTVGRCKLRPGGRLSPGVLQLHTLSFSVAGYQRRKGLSFYERREIPGSLYCALHALSTTQPT